jgi:putative tryptophan/tyrosine transport system substrate-binding protein
MFLLFEKYFKYWIRSIGILCLFLFISTGEISSQTVHILIVKSAFRTEYEQTTKEIKSSLQNNGLSFNTEEILFNSSSDEENDFWMKIVEKQPDLIITVGTLATRSAVNNVLNIPIIFTMVLDHIESMNSKSTSSNKNISGVTLAIPVEEQFDILREAMPFVRRVGLIYSRQSAQMYYYARDITNKMGLRLFAYEITSERDIPNAMREILPEIDVLWMPPDAILYNEPNILRFVLRESFTNSVPIIAVSKHLAMAGTPLSLGIDYEDIGKQTAELVLKRFSSNSISTSAIETPRHIILYINNRVLSSLGLNIPSRVLEKAIPVESER